MRGRRFADRSASGWGPAFLDRDGDGVCDHYPGPGRRGQGRRLGPGANRVPGSGAGPAAAPGRGRGWRWR
ncbi:MAG TPA: hypothetical protein PKK95_14740 [Vicinamibacterales bacterium]|nr:hypothetical protein [Vicinamibacterales bacterium]